MVQNSKNSINYDQILKDYNDKGFAVIENFLQPQQVDQLLSECASIVEQVNIDKHHKHVFKTGENQGGDDYFINSGDKISYFFEEKAFNKNGELIKEKEKCINKIGHALHWHNKVFKEITFSTKMKELIKHVGFVEPAIVQSMIIFKNPKLGGEVVAHQDATFLFTCPVVKVAGIWIALADATIENGCLWFIPESHNLPVSRRFIRNPDQNPRLIFTGSEVKYNDDHFVPVQVKKGSLIMIHGQVVHKSEVNLSNSPRPAYTFHVIDKHDTKWSEDNWLQPSKQLSFPLLYDN